MGRYSNQKICDSQNLRHVATALARQKLEIKLSSFELIRSQIMPGDFIYFDRPIYLFLKWPDSHPTRPIIFDSTIT